MNEILPEMLKDTVGLSWLICLCSLMWRSETAPVEWGTGMVVKKCAPIIGVNSGLLLVQQISFTSDGKMEQEMDRWFEATSVVM